MRWCVLGLLVCLVGCAGDHRGTQHVQQDAPGLGWLRSNNPPSLELTERSRGELKQDVRTEVQASSNALQQSFSGLGLQLGKVAEKVEASLVRVEKLETHLQQVANIRLEVSPEVKAELNAIKSMVVDLKATVTLQVKIAEQLQVKVAEQLKVAETLQANGIAAWKAEVDQSARTAGRDQHNTQLDKETQAVLNDAFTTTRYVIYVSCGVLIVAIKLLAGWVIYDKEQSRRRADERSNKDRQLLLAVLKCDSSGGK